MTTPTLYKNFSWRQTIKANEGVCMENSASQEQFMNFCNNLNDQGWIIMGTTPVGNGKVVHCKSKPDQE